MNSLCQNALWCAEIINVLWCITSMMVMHKSDEWSSMYTGPKGTTSYRMEQYENVLNGSQCKCSRIIKGLGRRWMALYYHWFVNLCASLNYIVIYDASDFVTHSSLIQTQKRTGQLVYVADKSHYWFLMYVYWNISVTDMASSIYICYFTSITTFYVVISMII